MQPDSRKTAVHDFWNAASCGEVYAVGISELEMLKVQEQARYQLEPYLAKFARFNEQAGKDVLEIGVGMGADHLQLARSRPKSLNGIDLTQRAIEFTARRLSLFGAASDLQVGDAERLPFADCSFDFVYSWGVLHHTPDTAQAFRELHRVLRPGGTARVMIYHLHSLVGVMLWLRYGVFRGRNMRAVIAEHLESPGTKAYTKAEARDLCSAFSEITISTQLSFGDLLEGEVGQQHSGFLLRLAKKMWPRALLRRVLPQQGLYLLMELKK